MKKNVCQKCGHKWWPRTPDKPTMCPACKCRNWDKKAEDKE